MKNQQFKEKYKSVVKTINFYTAALLLFALPLSRYFVPLIINFWILTWILEGDFKEKFQFRNLRKNKLIFGITLAFCAVFVIGYFYSENKSEAYSFLETRLTIFLFPILLSTANFWYQVKFKFLLWSFILGNLFAATVCLVNAFYQSTIFESGYLVFNSIIKTNYPVDFQQSVMWGLNRFFSSEFSIFLHPSYFTLFLNFAILILIRYFSENQYNKKILTGLILFFFLIIFLLSSKIGIMTAIISAIYFIHTVTRKVNLILKFSIILIFSMVIGILISKYSYRFSGIKHTFESVQEQNMNVQNIIARLNIWKSSIQIIKENPILGVGTGDVKDELKKEYIHRNFTSGIEMEYNSHNQYLEMWAANGLPGILMLLLFLGVPLYFAFRKKNALFIYFIIFFMINLSVESMLNRMASVIFFAFFYNFLFFIDTKMKDFQVNNLPQNKSDTLN